MEGQLQKIYELIDRRRPSEAILHCDRLLRKYPTALILVALKGLATYYSGDREAAKVLCDRVAKSRPTELTILQPVSIVYKGISAHGENSKLYEQAMAADRMRDEEIPAHLFMSLAREGKYKEQQQLALKMGKAYDKSRYTFWAVVALLLQARTATTSRTLLYTLAERIMQKAREADLVQTHEELLLFIQVYSLLDKPTEVIALLTGDLASRVKFDLEMATQHVDCLISLSRWEEAQSMSLGLIRSNPAEWSYAHLYIRASFHKDIPSAEALERAHEVARAPILFLQNTPEGQKHTSSILLIQLGLLRAYAEHEHRVSEEPFTHATALLLDYFKSMCGKESVIVTLRPYLSLLRKPADKAAFTDGVGAYVSRFTSNPSTPAQVFARVNRVKLQLALFPPILQVDKRISLAKEQITSYVKLKAVHEGAIQFLILAGTILLGAYTPSAHTRIIAPVIRLLEGGLLDQPQSYPVKLLLLRAYTLDGNGRGALSVYRSLGVKSVQSDTLAHLMMDHAPWLLPSEAGEVMGFRTDLDIYWQNERDTPEMIVQAYNHGSYSQILEFVELQRRLTDSLQQGVSRTQKFWVDLGETRAWDEVEEMMEEVDEVWPLSEELADNRDFTVFPTIGVSGEGEERASRPLPRLSEAWARLHGGMIGVYEAMVLGQEALPQATASLGERLQGVVDIPEMDVALAGFLHRLALALTVMEKGGGEAYLSTCQALLAEASVWKVDGEVEKGGACPFLQRAYTTKMQLHLLTFAHGYYKAHASLPDTKINMGLQKVEVEAKRGWEGIREGMRKLYGGVLPRERVTVSKGDDLRKVFQA